MIDFTKPYGTILGHAWARFEQGSTLYDCDGKSYDEQSTDRQEHAGFNVTESNLTENAREFLMKILAEGPMKRTEVNKESDLKGYNWLHVKGAASELKVSAYKIRDNIMWRLPLE